MKLLLDTNVVSELRKPDGRRDAAVSSWFATVPDDALYSSVLVIGELRRGIEQLRRRDLAAADALDRWLTQLRANYSARILGINDHVAEVWGRINVPKPLPAVDGLMAATALVHGLTLVTRNVHDVERSGVALIDPWGEPTP